MATPRFQRWNDARTDIQGGEASDFRHITETVGRPGIWNGQFAQYRRPYTWTAVVTSLMATWPWPEGWEFWPTNPHTIVMTNADQVYGDYSVQLTQAGGAGAPGYILQSRFIPANNLHTYTAYASMRASGALITCRWGFQCYGVGKAALGPVWGYAAAPGVAWVEAAVNFGAAGTAFAVGTVWVRFVFEANDITPGSWVRVDGIHLET